MTSRRKSTPAPPSAPSLSPAISSTFRATLLWRLENPGYAQALDTVGELLWEFVNETHQFGPPEVEKAPFHTLEYNAAAKELRSAAAYLQDLAHERTFCSLNRRETDLAGQAEGWAVEILEIAGRIEKAAAD